MIEIVVETHDEVYDIWRNRNLYSATIVHIDAHSDYFPSTNVCVGSFIYHAMREDMIRRFYWVVPNATIDIQSYYERCIKELKRYGLLVDDRTCEATTGRLGSMYVWIGTLGLLPEIEETVCLDIDIDYFTTPFAGTNAPEVLVPWMLPHELYSRLRSINKELTTISASIIGGYTPIHWVCLANIAKEREANCIYNSNALKRLKKGAALYSLGRIQECEEYFSGMLSKNIPVWCEGAIHSWMTRLDIEGGRLDDARSHWEIAVAIDASYQTFWICPGFWLWRNDNTRQAAVHFERWSPLLKNQPEILIAWAFCIRQQQLDLAEQLCKRALKIDRSLPDAFLCLGKIAIARGDTFSAIDLLNEGLEIMKTGVTTLFEPIRSPTHRLELNPEGVVRIVRELAFAYSKVGDARKAGRYIDFLRENGLLLRQDEMRLKKNVTELPQNQNLNSPRLVIDETK